VDTPAVVDNELQNNAQKLREAFRKEHLRYSSIDVKDQSIRLHFRDAGVRDQSEKYIQKNFTDLQFLKNSDQTNDNLLLSLQLTQAAQSQIESYAVNQTVNVMRNRVNELGVAEASVAQQGPTRVVIELPGLQDAARAKEIIGGTSTLKVMLVNESADVADALAGHVPSGSRLYLTQKNQPVVLYDSVIITGNSVVGANAGFDSQTNQPIVSVILSGSEVSKFSEVTAANVGHLMAIVLVDQTFTKQTVNGKVETKTQETDKVISVANIMQRLDNRFQITGLSSREAQSLSLSIRAGALPAPVQIIEEKHIGPSLGAENIKMGAISVVVAMLLIMIFIGFYYHVFGLIANFALILNLIFIVAIMAIMPGATLTLPGIAGIVLNVGMAIDSNVLIFERIREELRNGASVQAAIYSGYDRAFSTIVDSNVTTFIVAVILFSIGSGAIKGFSVTLMIGIVTSMFTALVVGRAMVNFWYGSRSLKWLSIGIRPLSKE
jgi:preprotein translocase subunit SecD